VFEKNFIKRRGHSYTIETLANDAVVVMRDYGFEKFHVVGCPIAASIVVQNLMINHSSRLLSATMISSTFGSFGEDGSGVGAGVINESLETDGDTANLLKDLCPTKFINRLMKHEDEIQNDFERRFYSFAAGELDNDKKSIANFEAFKGLQKLVLLAEPSDRRPQLRESTTPCLVIHGTKNSILRYEHGIALAKAIPGAELMTVEGGNHALFLSFENQIIERISALIMDCSVHSEGPKKKIPKRFSTHYTGFEVDIQTVSNQTGFLTNSLRG